MPTLRLPGLVDVHVHMRDPGATHKEDWDTGTAAALAGGITAVLAMPNTAPPIADAKSFDEALAQARKKARCDYAQFLGAGPETKGAVFHAAERAAGLKMYLDQTFGPLRLDDMTLWAEAIEQWPRDLPIAIHAESRTLAAAILMAHLYDRPLHLCHVSTREEILLIRKAKEKGIPVTCEVSPHHLFLSQADIPRIGEGRAEVRPRLAAPEDQAALWENLDIIDVFATDHAPHTLAEKDGENPPPGFPGLETALPLLLTALGEGRLTLEDIISRMHENPRRIFNLPEQPDTWIEVDPDEKWEIRGESQFTRCGWTPFEGKIVRGKVKKVVLRGSTAYENGKVIVRTGYGRNLREDPSEEPYRESAD